VITAQIPYTLDTGEKLVNETFGPNNIQRRTQGTVVKQPMSVADGRAVAAELALEKNGFVLVDHPTAMVNFFDPEELKSVYYPEVERLIKRVAGAQRVVIFDHTLRSGDEGEREEADTLLERRFAIVQVWRAIGRPIETNPLALADARTVAMGDLLVAERRYPTRVGQTYRLKHNPQHRWFYFPRMRRDEAIVFKVYDSLTDGRARFTPHTAFDDPTTPPGAPPRQSIEARAFAFF
jgi:hypothetical protein